MNEAEVRHLADHMANRLRCYPRIACQVADRNRTSCFADRTEHDSIGRLEMTEIATIETSHEFEVQRIEDIGDENAQFVSTVRHHRLVQENPFAYLRKCANVIHMNYETSVNIVKRAVSASSSANIASSIVVVDRAGNIVASARMDGSNFLAHSIAHRKARTAGVLGLSTQDFADSVRDDTVIVAALSCDPLMVLLGGGVPIVENGVVVGGIGVSGADQHTDAAIASQGLLPDFTDGADH
jgi:uncharacterized protein GlcG (DUF336 family)